MTNRAGTTHTIDSKIIRHFQTADPVLASVFETVRIDIPVPKRPEAYFEELCSSIIGQQLSIAVADVIYARFARLFPKNGITPMRVLACPDDVLRACGMSRSKVVFLKAIAQAVDEKTLNFQAFSTHSDEEVIEILTRVKGIGPWTAEMFLMFTLGRADVFSFGDLGLKRAIQSLYALRKEPSRATMERLSRKWKPYRTYAALALWKYKDA